MNTQTFLLNNYNTFSPKVTRLFFILFGLLCLSLILYKWLIAGQKDYENPIIIIGAINFLLMGTLGLSKKSPFAPKVKITDQDIILRKDIIGKNTKVKWDVIEKIELGSYQLTFHKKDSYFTFHLDTTKESSIAIKQAIKKAGNHKNVLITGY
ncbi:MAG: hypothetical protein ACPGRC_02625 [Salibacteraceae bacterium]